ncbi:MAG: IclR family transcriptional regulator [Treponema sp.]|nr:IclR family transcriptional regulator [Treponema sp.]
MEKEPKVKSLQKALDVLSCFSSKKPKLGVSEIARMLDLNKSNVHNILSTLESAGYVRKGALTDKYLLGNKILELSYTVMSSYKYTNAILPEMEALSKKLNAIVYFAIPHGTSVLYLFASYPSSFATNIPYRSIMGETAPFYCTSLGKAMLMTMDKTEMEEHLNDQRIQFTPNTFMDNDSLFADIEESRKRGYAIDEMELEMNVRSVGVPVKDRNGKLIGALSASGPGNVITVEKVPEIAQELLTAAFQIRERI